MTEGERFLSRLTEAQKEAVERSMWSYEKTAVVSVTKFCNQSCSCCLAQKSRVRERIDFDAVDPLLRSLQGNGWTLEISGGEPMTVDGIVSWLNEVSMRGNIMLLTNGYRMSEIEHILNPDIGVQITWHSTQKKIDDFYYKSTREKTEYVYVAHPAKMHSGQMEKDLKDWKERTDKKLHITFFEGVHEGKYYDMRDSIYESLDPEYAAHLAYGGKNIQIEANGAVYHDYDFSKPVGFVPDYQASQAESAKWISYLDCIAANEGCKCEYAEDMTDRREPSGKEWTVAKLHSKILLKRNEERDAVMKGCGLRAIRGGML